MLGGLILEIILNKAIEILKAEFNPIVIYLFGSATKNRLSERM